MFYYCVTSLTDHRALVKAVKIEDLTMMVSKEVYSLKFYEIFLVF
jgi:hypothetical protein